jgi:hypothetical protein
MMLNHRFLLTSGFTILSVVVLVGGASAQSAQSSASTKHHHTVQLRHPLYNYYSSVAPVVPVVRPGCYLPSDGCPNEYSVQN